MWSLPLTFVVSGSKRKDKQVQSQNFRREVDITIFERMLILVFLYAIYHFCLKIVVSQDRPDERHRRAPGGRVEAARRREAGPQRELVRSVLAACLAGDRKEAASFGR